MSIFDRRQGQMGYNYPYFYTDTIVNFKHLLSNDEFKTVIIQSLQFLVRQKLVQIYGFVIMPNHIHLIWNMLKLNGKESPAASFTKFTAHQFRKQLISTTTLLLKEFKSDKGDRNYQF